MSKRDDRVTILDMLDFARDAQLCLQGRTRLELDSDRIIHLALTRALELIGEAATRLSAVLRDAHPEIPWSQIIGLRNRLIHGYDAVDADRLWQIVQVDVPKLIVDLQAIINQTWPANNAANGN